MIKKVYIASPFFNDTEERVVEEIKTTLEKTQTEYYSPKDELRFDKSQGPEKAKECFDLNLEAMDNCDLMVANIEGFDPGTIFEMGYFTAIKKPILAYSEVEGRKLNLMLANACIGFANSVEELQTKLEEIKEGKFVSEKYHGEQE
jgi:nucleoside 2-deoxyribosyltransferase